MSKAWNYYLSAFRNTFNYKDSASGEELRWFSLLMFILGILFSLFLLVVRLAVMGEDTFSSIISTYLPASIFFIIHAFPLCSLVKRRFNRIAPLKTKLFFSGWLAIWAIFLICQIVVSFFFSQLENTDYAMELVGYVNILQTPYILTGFLLIVMVVQLSQEKPIK